MVNVKKILCPVDFFPASDNAFKYAAGLAANYDATIHLLHVVTPIPPTAYQYVVDPSDIMSAIQASSAEEMDKLVAGLKGTGVRTETQLRLGDVYDEIKQAIEEVKPDLIVMGTHGRRGVERWFMGSTTEKLLRHSPVPLVTIGATGEKPLTPPRRILVTTDFSEGTSDALAFAFSVAQENESEVTLLHVVNDIAGDVSRRYRDSLINGVRKQLEDMVPAEARNWCNIVTRVETGVPHRIIKRVLEDERIDLLVMNIHGKGMLDRALLGSTADRVVRTAGCPVMLIPPLRLKLKRKARPGGLVAA
jgi:nucleotide-binding universal stress UspA family protein